MLSLEVRCCSDRLVAQVWISHNRRDDLVDSLFCLGCVEAKVVGEPCVGGSGLAGQHQSGVNGEDERHAPLAAHEVLSNTHDIVASVARANSGCKPALKNFGVLGVRDLQVKVNFGEDCDSDSVFDAFELELVVKDDFEVRVVVVVLHIVRRRTISSHGDVRVGKVYGRIDVVGHEVQGAARIRTDAVLPFVNSKRAHIRINCLGVRVV